MEFSASKKVCSVGNDCKQLAITSCEGCSLSLCSKHYSHHRKLLNDEVTKIISEHGDLKNTLTQQTKDPSCHPLLKQVSEWETQSILKIQQRAKELRLQLSKLTKSDSGDLSQKLQQLGKQINESRTRDDFLETDIQQWKDKLEDIKRNIISPSRISVSTVSGSHLVQDISVTLAKKNTSDVFERVYENLAQIEDDGHLIVQVESLKYVDVRGKNEYKTGTHKIQLCIEEYPGTWLFLGINSKLAPLQNKSTRAKSTYGWSSNNYSWINGQPKNIASMNPIEIKSNDIISFIIDCENFKISMINESTKATHELSVDTNYCTLPWQFQIILFDKNTRIRLLPADLIS